MAQRRDDSVVRLLEKTPPPQPLDSPQTGGQSTVALSPKGQVFVLGSDGLSVGSLPDWKRGAQMQRLTESDFVADAPNIEQYTHLKLNEDASLLLLYGPQSIAVMFTDKTKNRLPDGETEEGYLLYDFTDDVFTESGDEYITQADWHSLEQSTFCVLTTSFTFVVVDVQPAFFVSQLEEEEVWDVHRKAVQKHSIFANSDLVGFTFGGDAFVWLRFAVFFLGEAGEVYVLCPIIPTNTILAPEIVAAMRDSAENWRHKDVEYYDRLNAYLQQLLGTNRTVADSIAVNSTFCAEDADASVGTASPSKSLQLTPGGPSPYKKLSRRYRNSRFHHFPVLQGPLKTDVRLTDKASSILMLRRVHGPALCRASEGGRVDMFVLSQDVHPMWDGSIRTREAQTLPRLIFTDNVQLPMRNENKHPVFLLPDPATPTAVHAVVPSAATAMMLHLEWLDRALEQTTRLATDIEEIVEQRENMLGRRNGSSLNLSRSMLWEEETVIDEVRTHVFVIARFPAKETGDIVGYQPLQDAILGHKLLIRFQKGGVRWENLSVRQQRWAMEARQRSTFTAQHAQPSQPWQLPNFADATSRLKANVRERIDSLRQVEHQPAAGPEGDANYLLAVEQNVLYELYPHVEEFKFRTQAQAQSLRRVKEEQQKRLQALREQLERHERQRKELAHRLYNVQERLMVAADTAAALLEQAEIAAEPSTSGELVMREKLDGWAKQCDDMRNRLGELDRQLRMREIRTRPSPFRSPQQLDKSRESPKPESLRSLPPQTRDRIQQVLNEISGVLGRTSQLQRDTLHILQDVPVVRAELFERLASMGDEDEQM